MQRMFTLRRAHAHTLRGFSLVELMVSIVIFTLIITVVLANYRAFNSSTLLTDLGYQVALSVRQAQIFGISAKYEAHCANDPTSPYPYGTYFDLTTPTQYLLFQDKNCDRTYNAGTDIVVSTYTIGQGNRLTGLCVQGASSCTSVNNLTLTFLRPNPDATIRYNGNTGGALRNAEITVGATSDVTRARTVTVSSIGQISVEGI